MNIQDANKIIIESLKFFDIDASEIDRRIKSGENPSIVESDIKKRCRDMYPKLLKKYHPDTNSDESLGEAERHEKFIEFSKAKEIIETKFRIGVSTPQNFQGTIIIVRSGNTRSYGGYNFNPTSASNIGNNWGGGFTSTTNSNINTNNQGQ